MNKVASVWSTDHYLIRFNSLFKKAMPYINGKPGSCFHNVEYVIGTPLFSTCINDFLHCLVLLSARIKLST